MFFLAILGLSVQVAAAEPDTTSSANNAPEVRGEHRDAPADGDEGPAAAADDGDNDERGEPTGDGDGDDDGDASPRDAADDSASFAEDAWQHTAPVGIDADPSHLVGDPDDFGVDADWLSAHSDGREEALRRGTSWLGRVDVGVTWRATWSQTAAGDDRRRDVVLLVGTWRL